MSDFLKAVRARVVIYNGAMGTNIQLRNPTLDDHGGKENCSEVLVLSRPDMIRVIHADFLGVGCDVVETNTLARRDWCCVSSIWPTGCRKSTWRQSSWREMPRSNSLRKTGRASLRDRLVRRRSCLP